MVSHPHLSEVVNSKTSKSTAKFGCPSTPHKGHQQCDIASVRLLLAAGANPNKPDNAAGLSAREYAKRDPRSSAILKEIVEAKPVSTKPVQGPR